jgi:hypothetical protein
MKFFNRYYPQIVAVLSALGLFIVLLDLLVWRPN